MSKAWQKHAKGRVSHGERAPGQDFNILTNRYLEHHEAGLA